MLHEAISYHLTHHKIAHMQIEHSHYIRQNKCTFNTYIPTCHHHEELWQVHVPKKTFVMMIIIKTALLTIYLLLPFKPLLCPHFVKALIR